MQTLYEGPVGNADIIDDISGESRIIAVLLGVAVDFEEPSGCASRWVELISCNFADTAAQPFDNDIFFANVILHGIAEVVVEAKLVDAERFAARVSGDGAVYKAVHESLAAAFEIFATRFLRVGKHFLGDLWAVNGVSDRLHKGSQDSCGSRWDIFF